MKSKRYSEGVKREAVKQVTEPDYSIAEAAQRPLTVYTPGSKSMGSHSLNHPKALI